MSLIQPITADIYAELILLMIRCFCLAVLNGRIQLFETMKRDGAGSQVNVVTVQIGPQGSDAKHRPITDCGRSP